MLGVMENNRTPLIALPALAEQLGVRSIFLKCEDRRQLGNFKSLGGAHAARLALSRLDAAGSQNRTSTTLICASDGNHGLAVAAAAQEAGVGARIYLPHHVSGARASRITDLGAEIVRVHGTYDQAVREASAAAARGEGLLIADTSDDPDDVVVSDVMAGYATIAEEVRSQLNEGALPTPTHLFVQAGVGGFAAAMAEGLSPGMSIPRRVVVVEPRAAACVAAGLAHGVPVQIEGTLDTCAEMLSCGAASASALNILLWHSAAAVQVSEDALYAACRTMEEAGGPASTPSGAAGLAGLLEACGSVEDRRRVELDHRSVVLLFATEGVWRGDERN